MNWVYKIQQAIDYIECNLENKINVEKVAQAIMYSPTPLQYLFNAMTGYSVGEYIRFRRLDCAVIDLVDRNLSVTETAFKYHYETVEAFSKAFKREYGVSPSKFTKDHLCYRKFAPIKIDFNLTGGYDMTKNFMSELKSDKLVETLNFNGVVFEVMERPEVLWVGTLEYETETEKHPDMAALRRFQDLCSAAPKVDRINPDWTGDITLNIHNNTPETPFGVMYGQETYSAESQDGRYDIYSQPSGLYMRILNDEKAAALFNKDKCENHELIGYIRRKAAPQNGYQIPNNIDLTVEYNNSGISYVYVAVEKK